jgi:hypothetical protein
MVFAHNVVFAHNTAQFLPPEPSSVHRVEQPMESYRQVVWTLSGILGFQGGSLVLNAACSPGSISAATGWSWWCLLKGWSKGLLRG